VAGAGVTLATGSFEDEGDEQGGDRHVVRRVSPDV